MADQVHPTGSLASGLPSALLVVASPRTAGEKTRTARTVETQSLRQGNRGLSEAGRSPEMAVEKLNSHLQLTGSELKLQSDSESGRLVIKVVIPATGQVLFQVPSEEVLALARNLRSSENEKGASGVLVDKEG